MEWKVVSYYDSNLSKIYSVQRLSDKQIFCVGEEVGIGMEYAFRLMKALKLKSQEKWIIDSFEKNSFDGKDKYVYFKLDSGDRTWFNINDLIKKYKITDFL